MKTISKYLMIMLLFSCSNKNVKNISPEENEAADKSR
jgi:hypothetical protein